MLQPTSVTRTFLPFAAHARSLPRPRTASVRRAEHRLAATRRGGRSTAPEAEVQYAAASGTSGRNPVALQRSAAGRVLYAGPRKKRTIPADVPGVAAACIASRPRQDGQPRSAPLQSVAAAGGPSDGESRVGLVQSAEGTDLGSHPARTRFCVEEDGSRVFGQAFAGHRQGIEAGPDDTEIAGLPRCVAGIGEGAGSFAGHQRSLPRLRSLRVSPISSSR